MVTSLESRAHDLGRTFLSILILASLLSTVAIAGTTRAEIPHENYDIANPDLATVINLLNTSIRASEEALQGFYNQTLADADNYLAMVDNILVPAEQVLSQIEDIAGSYENLSIVLPPFLELRSQMESFSSYESDLLDARALLLGLKDFTNLSDEDLVTALGLVKTVNSLAANMNRTIDNMLVSADSITEMIVDDRTPFKPNYLRPLIEKLRELLSQVLAEIDPIIHDEIPWGPERSFLVLWVENTTVYLGERIVGGGYLFYNGSFRGHHLVHVLWDGTQIIGTTTGQNGAYGFILTLGINTSLLGQHRMTATAVTPYTSLSSDEITVLVLLMPTTLGLDLDKKEMSITDSVIAKMTLVDVYGRPVPQAECSLDVDGDSHLVSTDATGTVSRTFDGTDLGFGIHSFGATYFGVPPYESSSSDVLLLDVSIPTRIELELFSEKFAPGYIIVGKGKLIANQTQPLESQRIALLIDEHLALNVTTDEAGQFAISIPSTDLAGGTHTLRAAFADHGVIWRYCDADVNFVITKLRRAQYPFFPFFPGWQTGPQETIPYLFFGPYAYYFWLLMLAVLAVIVRTLQARRARSSSPRTTVVEVPLAAMAAGVEAASPSPEQFVDWTAAPESPRDPNARIVWLYGMLLEFLRKKRKVTITEDMTHWEVARLLRSLGYPRDSVERVTILFERAFYSGSALSDIDSVGMSVAMDGVRAGGAENAQ